MTIEARLNRSEGALTTLSNGRHVWHADVSQALGSGDAAPDPHELLDSALAACTALTLELYLRRRDWPVSALQVRVDHVESRDAEGRVHYRLQREITVTGALSDEQRARLLEVANKCPVHRILEGEVTIETRWR